jgi:hypothetical protein
MGTRFSAFVQTSHGAHIVSRTMGTGSFPRVKRPGRGVDHPHPSKAVVTKRNKAVSVLHLWAIVAYYKARSYFSFNTILSHMQWRTEGGWGFNPPKFRSFDKAESNSQFRGKYIRNGLVFLFHHPN